MMESTQSIERTSPGRTGRFRYAVLDFDGTLSLVREGWQQIMVPYFADELCSTPQGRTMPRDVLELRAREFITLLTGKQTIYDEELEENQTWFFQTKGSVKGQGYHGVKDNQVYVNGLLQKADPALRYMPVSIGEKRYLVNTSGAIQKASSTSTSSARPELGKGFKDIKDSNETIWTVDSSGIIQ